MPAMAFMLNGVLVHQIRDVCFRHTLTLDGQQPIGHPFDY